VTRRWSSADLISVLTDRNSFTPWDDDATPDDPLGFTDTRPYSERLDDARRDAPTTEAVVTGVGRLDGRRVALVVGEFAFLAGTQGLVVGERVTRAFDRAAVRGLPVLGLPISGGTRMQEGSLAFVQMLKIAAAVGAHRRRGGRYIAWLRHPTTGGVLASWASLADVTFAQPNALIGLTGPRVVEEVEGVALPMHVQRSDHLATHGIVDDVVALDGLRSRLVGTLDALGDAPAPGGWTVPATPDHDGAGRSRWRAPDGPLDAWEAVRQTRRPERPGVHDLLGVATAAERLGARVDDGCVIAVCRLDGVRALLIGSDRAPGGRGAGLGPSGYCRARAAMWQAAALGVPIVTVVDTRGALTTAAAESGGTAREIARSMATLAHLPVPVVAVLLGEGAGGGAIAWLAADHVVAATDAWLAPIAPEGASAILHRTQDHAADLARSQAIDVGSLTAIGLVDETVDLVGDGPGAVARAVAAAARRLAAQPTPDLLTARARKLRSLG
jgi:acetyl-CoA carboxylase carboxyl transferase beta subunit